MQSDGCTEEYARARINKFDGSSATLRVRQFMHECADLPDLRTAQQFAGCPYVLEGATLGDQVILRHLRKRSKLTTRDGTAFSAGDGASTGARWKSVLEWLELVAHSDRQAAQIVAATRATCSALTHWAFTRGIPHEH